MANDRKWTVTQSGQSRTWTVNRGVGPAGPNTLTTNTSTDLSGLLAGDGSNVGVASNAQVLAALNGLSPSFGTVTGSGSFFVGNGTFEGEIDAAEVTGDVAYTLPAGSGGRFVVSTSGAGAPGSAPDALRQIYHDTTNGVFYVSKGTSTAADWVPFATEDGRPIAYNATIGGYRALTLSGTDGSETMTWDTL